MGREHPLPASCKDICLAASAQCYPRHACPLYASLFMHVHVPSLTAPALALQTLSDPIWIMRIHASICTFMQKKKAT